MTLEDVIQRFIEVKQDQPTNADELLDFVQACYMHNELSIACYRNLFKDLDARGAKKPDYYSRELIN